MTKITVIVAAPDCSSVQTFPMEIDGVFAEIAHAYLPDDYRDFEVIAVVEGWPNLKVRDDGRTAERGVQ